MVATALHKVVTLEIVTQRAELDATDAADRRIVATPPESESEEPTVGGADRKYWLWFRVLYTWFGCFCNHSFL
jgi:hypothetical protein